MQFPKQALALFSLASRPRRCPMPGTAEPGDTTETPARLPPPVASVHEEPTVAVTTAQDSAATLAGHDRRCAVGVVHRARRRQFFTAHGVRCPIRRRESDYVDKFYNSNNPFGEIPAVSVN